MVDCWKDRSLTLLHAQLPEKSNADMSLFSAWSVFFIFFNESSGCKKNCINQLWNKFGGAKIADFLIALSSFISSPAVPPALGDMPPAWDDVNALSESAPEKSIVRSLVTRPLNQRNWFEWIQPSFSYSILFHVKCWVFHWVKKMLQLNLQTNPFGGRPHSRPSTSGM